jgi:S-disulfanyl-L-cysteine oxidoreductase SoxD
MRRVVWGLGVLALAACGAPPDPPRRPAGPAAAVVTRAPVSGPERFGFGTEATPARIALWDIDVKPDGEGLPPGRGTVAEGEAVYRAYCVACHGATGVEGPNSPLVATAPWEQWPSGRTIGNYWPYATTIFDYVSKAMPQTTPGILTADQTYAVIAYILELNGLVAEDVVMDAELLPTVELPGRGRFVPDDRRGGPEIR